MSTEFCGWGGWSTTPVLTLSSSYVQNCGKYKIFGGANKFSATILVKTFTELPINTAITIEFDVFKIDTWILQSFTFAIDDVIVVIKTFLLSDSTTLGNLCGNSFNEDIEHVSYTTPLLISSTLKLTFFSSLLDLPTVGSFGLNNLKVILINSCHDNCLTCSGSGQNDCLTCPTFAVINGGTCKCMDKFYMSTSSYIHCAECDPSCKTCDGATSSSCTACYGEDTLLTKTCTSPTCTLFLKKLNVLFILKMLLKVA